MNVYQSGLEEYDEANILKRQVPKPPHRHAAPAGPWPYIDNLADQESEEVIDAKNPPTIGSCGHKDCEDCKIWTAYPQSLFGNWTIKPVRKCGIEGAVRKEHDCTIHTVDVMNDGVFGDSGTVCVTAGNKREYWRETLVPERKDGIRVRAMFLDKMSGPVLQMLGTKYNVEPFFFSSSLNWIPSKYQENPIPKIGDHVTITLTFIRMTDDPTLKNSQTTLVNEPKPEFWSRFKSTWSVLSWWSYFSPQIQEVGKIDTLAPMRLQSSGKILYPDFLGIHMVRNVEGSTIISYHPDMAGSTTSAEDLFTRLKLVGRSVYWQIIVRKSKDPTLVFLAILWSAVYAWDEALETLYHHFSQLESRVINTNDVALTYELHVIRAHLLHYKSLLNDILAAVEFLDNTPNPAMDSENIDNSTRASDKELLGKECKNILSEIHRLELNRKTQDDRVKNVQHLVYSSVNIEDSRAMKRLSYITMFFLPASFVANAFSMNITELNPNGTTSLARFFEATLPLTLCTIWVLLAFQSRLVLRNNSGGLWKKLLWPLIVIKGLFPSTTPSGSPAYM